MHKYEEHLRDSAPCSSRWDGFDRGDTDNHQEDYNMTCWQYELQWAMACRGEDLTDLVANTLSAADMARTFDNGYGTIEGQPFTAWSTNYVYFPVCYDGSEYVSSVSRNPDGLPTTHIGG